MVKSKNRLFGDIATNVDSTTGRIDSASLDSDIATTDTSSNFASGLQSGGVDVAADANLNSFLTTFNLPTADGSAGQYLKTDGSGTIGLESLPSNATTSADGFMSSSDKTKLDGVETGATADQTAAEIKTAYESNSDTNAFTDALQTKLNGVETSADVTDATNVAAAGAVMESDTTTANMSFVVDEDDMTSNSPTKLPTQQSVKAYVDTQVATKDALSELSGDSDDITQGSTNLFMTTAERSKLTGIETGATADQTAAEIEAIVSHDNLLDFVANEHIDWTTDQGATDIHVNNIQASTTSVAGTMSSADKTKLDGIETGATADQTDAEIKTAYENNSDTNAFTDALQTKLNGIEASADVTDTANVTSAGAVMDSELTDETAVKAINQGLATTDSPSFVNATATGEINVGTHIDLTSQSSIPSYAEARLWYDSSTKTLSYYSDQQNVVHELGLEEHQRVYNSTGSTIAKGKPLYFAGNYTAGAIDVPTVGLADATDVNAYNAQGLAAADIPNNSYGYCIIAGQLHGVDTSGLNAGTNFFVGLTPGAVQNASPVYPNYPMCLGWVVNSDATDGVLLVNQQNHSVRSFRVQTDAHVGDDLIVGGNLTVQGTTTTTSSQTVELGASFQKLNEGDTIGAGNTTHTGSGLDDATYTGHFTGTASTTYYVKIDGTGTPDTFSWSKDNFSTTEATGVNITGDDQSLDGGISINFGTTTGHTLNDVWSGTAAPAAVDTGLFTNRNTGSSGVGYTHMGLFYDVSTDKWTLLDEYDPDPTGTINLSHASVSYGLLKLDSVEGNLTGNVTGDVSGNATTATTLANSRTISLGGDVSGSASFDGSADITITATVADNSHDHDNATTSANGFMSAADKTKLDGVETGATADQTDAEIKTAYENNSDTNAFTDALLTKLNGIETSATADQSAGDIEAIVSHDNLLDYVANEHIDWTTDQGATNININNIVAASNSTSGLMASADKVKLDAIESNATADQTAAEIEAIVSHDNLLDFVANEHIDWTSDQGATNIDIGNIQAATTSVAGSMSSADKTKLDGIETGATANQTDAEIKTAYENNADTNAFTDALQTKLNGIETSADVTDATNVAAAGALMDSELTSEASVKAINQGLATTDGPSFTDVQLLSSATSRIQFGDTGNNDNDVGYIEYSHSNDQMTFRVAGTTYAFKITNTNIISGKNLVALSDAYDLGTTSAKWGNVHFEDGIYANNSFGNDGQVLTSDGSGNTRWEDVPSGGISTGKAIAMAMVFG